MSERSEMGKDVLDLDKIGRGWKEKLLLLSELISSIELHLESAYIAQCKYIYCLR